MSTVARRITWQRGAVIVHASARGESQTIRARAAIITLPVGVLRHQRGDSEVPFDPPLPAATRAALSSIETGHVLKVALWFRTAYWETLHNGRYRDAGFFRAEGQPFSTYWTQLPERSNVIIAWAGGPKATALAGATHAELLKKALDGFGALFDEAALANEEFDGGAMHDWGPDPFARGAYSYVAVGGADSRAALATPVDDTLFFAGEATATDGQGGTLSGAFETGQRGAAEVAKRDA